MYRRKLKYFVCFVYKKEKQSVAVSKGFQSSSAFHYVFTRVTLIIPLSDYFNVKIILFWAVFIWKENWILELQRRLGAN
jgi:hypothetical protein